MFLKCFVHNPIIGKVSRISEPNITVNVVISHFLDNINEKIDILEMFKFFLLPDVVLLLVVSGMGT